MSISSVGGISPQAAPHPARPAAEGASPKHGAMKPEDKNAKELTVVTTHCNKEHAHDRSCPHSVSTVPDSAAAARPAPGDGEPGSRLDERA